jgi:hypothetical protein
VIVERVTGRVPAMPLTNDQRRARWWPLYRYFANEHTKGQVPAQGKPQ